MTSKTEAKVPHSAITLSGLEKVAVLLLALGKGRAAKLLKHFDGEELKALSQSAADLRNISGSDLEVLVEEFAQKFSGGVNFVGTAAEIRNLLEGLIPEESLAEATTAGEVPSDASDVWERISKLKVEALRNFLLREHPQTVALILSKIDAEAAAKAISSFPAEYRAGVLCRMLAMKRVGREALQVIELSLQEDLASSASSMSHTGIADILNRLEKTQSDAVLSSLAEIRPADVKALKNLLFTFEEIATLSQAARTAVLDQVPIERLVLALRGAETTFQGVMLSALTARSRRMVEAELQSGATPPPREIADARRAILDVVMKMAAKGEIEIRPPDDLSDITT